MRRGSQTAGRAGFTLIELLVVIAILALLAALVAAGIGKVKEGQQGKVTDQALTKLQKALEGQWKAICDQCRDDARTYPTQNKHKQFETLVSFCGGSEPGSVERAEALWMHMNLRRSMPHTFQEARTKVVLMDTSNNPVVTLPPSATFNQVPNVATGDPNGESAVLLYLILTQGGRGTNFSLDDAMQGAQMNLPLGTTSFTAFKDGFGNPIVYRRFYQNVEMNQPPYVRAGLTITDPLDPVGRLKLWRLPNGNPNPNLQKAVEAVFALPGATPQVLIPSAVQPPGTATNFDGLNKMATAISYGADGAPDLTGNTDDAFGYRVLRQGSKGD